MKDGGSENRSGMDGLRLAMLVLVYTSNCLQLRSSFSTADCRPSLLLYTVVTLPPSKRSISCQPPERELGFDNEPAIACLVTELKSILAESVKYCLDRSSKC